jgi:hypothetical protein
MVIGLVLIALFSAIVPAAPAGDRPLEQSRDTQRINLYYPVSGNEPPGAKAEVWFGERLVLERTDFWNPLDRDTSTQKPVVATVSTLGESFRVALLVGSAKAIECDGHFKPTAGTTKYVVTMARTDSGMQCEIKGIK